MPQDVTLTPLEQWKVLALPSPAQTAATSSAHQFPSDVRRPGMLYGKFSARRAMVRS